MAMVAIPWAAKLAAMLAPTLFLLLPEPWPTIATGQPAGGLGPAGRYRLKYTSFVPCINGVPVRVPTAGTYSPGWIMSSGDEYFPKASWPTAPGMIRNCDGLSATAVNPEGLSVLC